MNGVRDGGSSSRRLQALTPSSKQIRIEEVIESEGALERNNKQGKDEAPMLQQVTVLAATMNVSVIVNYTITVPNTASVGFSSASVADAQIQQLLATSISAGNFTSTLRTLALASGGNASALASVTAGVVSFANVTITSLPAVDDDGSNGDDDDGDGNRAHMLSMEAKIGVIVAAGVVGLGMIVVVIYSWLFAKPGKYGQQRKSLERTREIQIYI